MKGKDGREYVIVVTDEKGDSYFEIKDKVTNKVVDNGWLVISKNGTLRVERIK